MFRFLYRPLAAAIVEGLCSGGILLFETFSLAHRSTGRGPRSPEFYLSDGELLELFPGLEIIEYSEGDVGVEEPYFASQLVARKP